jgi:dTDP-4-dehydrorhamnose reductase
LAIVAGPIVFQPGAGFDLAVSETVNSRRSATIRGMAGKSPQSILVTGSHGQLGRSLAAACVNRNIEHEGRDLDTLDICDARAVRRWIVDTRPSVVVNTAAYTAVDACETHEETATAVNGLAVGHLATACNEVDALLIQISTDYVFSGDADHPYREDAAVAPTSAYGRSKLRGEELAGTAHRHLVVRTAWLYGRGGRNFVEAIRAQIDGGVSSLKVVADQRGCPTFCDDLADAVLDLAAAGSTGTIHAVNSGSTTWHGFASEIVRLLGSAVTVVPVATGDVPRPAPRPAYSVLDTARLEAALGRPMPPWQDGLRRYLEHP